MTPVSVSPAQLFDALLALLRSLGLLPYKAAPDQNPEDGGFATISAAESAAHTYVDSLGGSYQQRQQRNAQVASICGAARQGILSLSSSPQP